MSQFTGTPTRRSAGEIDVYTGLLCVATIILAVGIYFLITGNIEHSSSRAGASDGGPFTVVGD